jgi:hypothetical protein
MIQMAREPIFDLQGRTDLLRLFDPQSAAKFFCQRTFGRTAKITGHPANQAPANSRKREYINTD